ncbi:MAG: Bax inhibitor-1/YccA family protein [Dermatophilaceae bacterium]
MAGNNPVFQRIDKQIDQERYAGFGQPTDAPPGYPPPGTAYPPVSDQVLQDMYSRPSAGPVQTGRVTFDDVIMKTLGLFAVLLVAAGASWVLTAGSQTLTLSLLFGGMLGGLILGFVIAFMKKVSVPLIVGYALLEGLFVGALSQLMQRAYPGIVATAIIATLATFGGMFIGYKTGLVRVTERSRRVFRFALFGYLLFGLVNVLALLMGWTSGWGFGGSGLIGIGISVLGVGLASYSLAVDFDSIDHAVRAGAPEKYSWLLAHGLIVSVVWLYVEILRLLARLRD